MQKIHLKAPANWINDPNGFIYYKGNYHLFYQYFPYEPRWGTMHWGHAVSKDLTTWEHQPIALFPSKWNDRNGCYSGSAVEHNGKMYLYYTGVRYLEENPEDIHLFLNNQLVSAQMMLVSEDGIHFDNSNHKTTVIEPLQNPEIGCMTDTRDPKVWRGTDAWYMVLGSRTPANRGKLLFYRSYDLEKWDYVNDVSTEGLGYMWECPDYFEVCEEQILIFSPMGLLTEPQQRQNVSICTKVSFNEKECTMTIPNTYQMLDYGLDLYAPQTTTDAEGRRVMVAWARMPEPVDNNWCGMFCIPRVVEVRNGHICFDVHPNIKKEYSKKIKSNIEADGAGYLISVDINDGEFIDIGGYIISCNKAKIQTDRSKVFHGHNDAGIYFSSPKIEGNIHLDIYVDTNLIETYINHGEYVITNVVYQLGNYLDSHTANTPELYTLNESE